MSILIDKKSKIIVQGITGHAGQIHTKEMLKFGTKIVAGVTPTKGGQKVGKIPVYNRVKFALRHHDAEWSAIFVPAPFAKDAALEALEEGLNIVMITEGVPVHDTIEIMKLAEKNKLTVLGPNCPGLCSPGQSKIGIMPNSIFKKGKIGIVSRSGTLTYEVVNQLTENNIGQSSVVGIGGDPIIGMNFIDVLKLFKKDPQTKKVILVGEIGGNLEQLAAQYIKKDFNKKVIAYITGLTAPSGKTMGHAGAIIEGASGTAQDKIDALKKAGIKVATIPSEIIKLL